MEGRRRLLSNGWVLWLSFAVSTKSSTMPRLRKDSFEGSCFSRAQIPKITRPNLNSELQIVHMACGFWDVDTAGFGRSNGRMFSIISTRKTRKLDCRCQCSNQTGISQNNRCPPHKTQPCNGANHANPKFSGC
ncbi:hypothetical protein B0I72DRAFT_139344 [Yarrowia lipolytica]|nr:hypothetical protein B0I72DRAFT_139344 [Yarrowia lipolytica]